MFGSAGRLDDTLLPADVHSTRRRCGCTHAAFAATAVAATCYVAASTISASSVASSWFATPAPQSAIFAKWLAENNHGVDAVEAALDNSFVTWRPPQRDAGLKRCAWVINTMTTKDAGKPWKSRREKFESQSSDANTFYRATAGIFWRDFVTNGWGNFDLLQLGGTPDALSDGSPLEHKSTWTWVTGDQHLSNFGAWRNRHGDVVFSINDFDEAAVFDFQIDVWRLGVRPFGRSSPRLPYAATPASSTEPAACVQPRSVQHTRMTKLTSHAATPADVVRLVHDVSGLHSQSRAHQRPRQNTRGVCSDVLLRRVREEAAGVCWQRGRSNI